MPPTAKSTSHNISIPAKTSTGKRKGAAAAPENRHIEIIDLSSEASPKRLKTSHTSGNIGRAEISMLKNPVQVAPSSHAGAAVRPLGFGGHLGPRRLVIKNVRQDAAKDIEAYYQKSWKELDGAVTAILEGQQPSTPYEILCRGVEATCRKKDSDKLFRHLQERCTSYMQGTLLSGIRTQAQGGNVQALRAVIKHWTVWNQKLTLIRSIFSYLDRSYLLVTKGLPTLEEMGIESFRKAVFGSKNHSTPLGREAILGVCALVECDRQGNQDLFDPELLKLAITTLHILHIYSLLFESEFLKQSQDYFDHHVIEHSSTSLKEQIEDTQGLLQRESHRCDRYNIDASTKNSLLKSAHNTLITLQSDHLLNGDGVSKLIDDNKTGPLKSLYDLLCLSGIQKSLREPWESHIERVGGTIVADKEKGDDMVTRLLHLKKTLDVVVRDAFHRNETFTHSLREAFAHFMNDRKNTQAWGTGSSIVGEMIAKYIDMLLRGGLKAVPRELISDDTDRLDAEKRGQSSTGDEDAELDRQLDNGLELFRFIEGKDTFEAFYKKDLARRLLLARSASQDAERNMLAKLRTECGNNFTHNLEQMFKDQELGRDEMINYKQSLSNTSKTTMDLQVNVLSASAWPSYPDVQVNLPAEVARHIEKYDGYYKYKHTGRRLTWKHALAHSVVRANLAKGPKELLVSAFQAIVLVLFNDLKGDEHLSYEAIATATNLIDAELIRTLQSLACAKLRVLTKHPKGRDVNPTDTFTINNGFSSPKYRVKINQIQLKETKEENKETHERVAQDRQYETQAAIVRIMKTRKTMTHTNLVTEVINQTKGRGAVEMTEIKRNIEKLIEKDYLERVGASYQYLA